MSLLDFPNELLFEIGGYLQVYYSITQAAMTCRCLYDLWTPQILAEHVATIKSLILARRALFCDHRGVINHNTFEPGEPFTGSYLQASFQLHPHFEKKDLAAIRSFICRVKVLDSVNIQLWDFNDIPTLAYILKACTEQQNLQLDVTNMYPRSSDANKEGGPFIFKFPQQDPYYYLIRGPSSNKRIATLFFNVFRPIFTMWPRQSTGPKVDSHMAKMSLSASTPPATYGDLESVRMA